MVMASLPVLNPTAHSFDDEINNLLQKTRITSNIAIETLVRKGLPKFVRRDINIVHIRHLLSITDVSRLKPDDRSLYFEICAAVEIFLNADYGSSHPENGFGPFPPGARGGK